jgi:hypothetical protein
VSNDDGPRSRLICFGLAAELNSPVDPKNAEVSSIDLLTVYDAWRK